MSTLHFAVGKARTKRPALRCKHGGCAHLTRHHSQVCPTHRGK
ncbi:hypothetical protein [Tomitella biformata]|nr:hypothetical protein [Tomitella biformata]